MKASGEFEVSLKPLESYVEGNDGVSLGRLSIDKTYSGDVAASSQGEMLTASTALRPLLIHRGFVGIYRIAADFPEKNLRVSAISA